MNASFSETPSPIDQPVLVVDKKGSIGKFLAQRLVNAHLTILVSGQDPPALPQCIHVPFRRKIPVVPDNTYSHIFVVYQGEKEILEALPSFLKKAKTNNSKVIVLTTIFHIQDKKIVRFYEHHPEFQLLILGDVFGELSLEESHVQVLLDQAKSVGRVYTPQDGLLLLYPVATEDVLEAILVLAMGTPGYGSFALFPKHPLTALSFVRHLQRAYPLLRLDFTNQIVPSPTITLPDDVTYIFGPNYPLEARLKKLDLRHTPLATPRHKKARKLRSPHLSSNQRYITVGLSVLLFLLALPLLLGVSLSAASGALLLSTKSAAEQGELQKAERSARLAATLFRGADTATNITSHIASGIGLVNQVTGYQEMVETGADMAEALSEGLQSAVVVQDVVQGKSSSPEEDFRQSLSVGREALRQIQRLGAEGRLPQRYEEELAKWQPTLGMLVNTMETFPALLGFEGEKTYLILFQNNYELRPTGGFIGSYGLVSVHKGRIGEVAIHDVYDADGQLKQKIVPPFALSRYLGASNWYLRDSNYYLDYPTSAATAANFLKMETGEEVDGVIAIDVVMLSNLLEATGPLYIADYQETLTEENFFLITQTHAEKDFFPGSTQKKDFLKAVRQTLESKLRSGTEVSYTALLSVLTRAVSEKHLLFAFADPTIQSIFNANKLSGSLLDTREKEQGRLLDFLYINETNIGQTKGNYYLQREIAQNVAIDGEGRVKEEVTVSYTNTSTKESPFGGEYKSYVRVVLPESAEITTIYLDGREQEIVPAVTDRARYAQDGFIPPRGMEVDEVIEDGQKVYGFLVTVPVQQSRKYTLHYTLSERVLVNQPEFIYDLMHVKQPGTENDQYNLEISYPVAARMVETSVPVNDLGGKLTLETEMRTDKNLVVVFAKQ